MRSGASSRSLLARWRPSTLQGALALFVAYAAAAYLSFFLRESPDSIAAIWPPSGLALAALLLADRKRWPSLALSIFVANALMNAYVGRPWTKCFGMATTNTVESLLGAWCILRVIGTRPTMREMKHVFALVFWGALFAVGVTSYVGGNLVLLSRGEAFGRLVGNWWIAVGSGILSVTPTVLVLAGIDLSSWRRVPSTRWLEVALLLAGFVGVIALVFGGELPDQGNPFRSPILVAPFLIWAAMRFGPLGSALAVFTLAVTTVWLTAHGFGPFADARMTAFQNVLALQVFLASLSIPTLALGALLAERWSVEEELRASQSTSRRAEEVAHIGSWSVEFGHEITATWSREKARILGIPGEMQRGTPDSFLRLVHVDDRERITQAIEAARADGTAYDVEHRIVRPDGRVRRVHGRGDVIRDEKGRPARMIGVLQDITERKQDETLLAVQKRILEKIASGSRLDATILELIQFIELESGSSACSVLLGDSKVGGGFRVQRTIASNLVSDGLQKLRGVVLDPMTGTCGSAAHSKQIAIAEDLALDPRYTSLREFTMPLGLRGTASAPILGLDGSTLGTICLFFGTPRGPDEFEMRLLDTATSLASVAIERARDADALLKLNSELEQRVLERTAQLEAANSELEAFSYSVSHDLRSPLRAIDGYTNIVLEDHRALLAPDGLRQLEMISASARRMGELIDDLLEFSRLSRQPLHVVHVEPTKLVESALAELIEPNRDRPLDVRVHPMPACTADPSLLRQVFVNLIDNAIKFSRGRQPTQVEIGAIERDGEIVYFVRDNGVGFDMRHVDKLFDVFQRLHHDLEFPGTGVGLALTQRIVQRHGGRIWAEAMPHKGATFYFTLLP